MSNMGKTNKKRPGKIIKLGGLNVWPHEQAMADILASAGHTVEFIPVNNRKNEHTADCLIDSEKWEMKAPRAGNLKTVERNLKRARW